METLVRNCFEFGPMIKEMLFKDFFLFLAVVAILFSTAKPFVQL